MFTKKVSDQFKPETVPAPVQGLNAYDSIVAMQEGYAITLQNWWPQPYGCSFRKGYVQWATGFPSSVQSLATWFGTTAGTKKLFAWSLASMYDITTRGAIGAASVTGLTNASWESVCYTNSAGSRMIAVNGADNGITYTNAGGVQRITVGDGIVINTWAGLSPLNAVQLTVHQKRLWAVKKDTTEGWYLPPDAFQGTFAKFDFGPQFKKGGFLQYLTTWTLDDGNGAEDHLLAMSSQGEAVVYSGTDPTDSTKWGLVGVYFVGTPLAGRRGFTKAGGDVLLLTQQGVISMTEELTSVRVTQATQPLQSKKIQFLVSDLASNYGTLTGWELRYVPSINMVLVNVPSVSAGGNIQLAANQITQAWTLFSNMDATCWSVFDELPYFGSFDGVVYQAWTGFSDKVLLDNTGGEGVTTVVQQAYTYFGGRSNNKQVGMYRPTFVASGEVGYNCSIVYDFADNDVATPNVGPGNPDSLWGTGLWGTGRWGGGSGVEQTWIQGEGMGIAISLKMVAQSISEVLWASTDYSVIQTRGIL